MLQDTIILRLSVTRFIIFLGKSMSEKQMLAFLVLLTAFLKRKCAVLTNCLCVDFLVLHSFLAIDGTGNSHFGPIPGGELRKISRYEVTAIIYNGSNYAMFCMSYRNEIAMFYF